MMEMNIMNISIIIPTYNRSDNILRTLDSLQQAEKPHGLGVEIILVDNNSRPSHGEKYKKIIDTMRPGLNVLYEFESRQGRSFACNRGLSVARTNWVGFIDDDEAIDPQWINRAYHWIQMTEVDYVGGACLPDWEILPPKWLPAHRGQYKGILGWIELRSQITSYEDFDGELCGGNFIARTELLKKVGQFNTSLGRSDGNLLGGEDGDLHRRVKNAHAKGYYDPLLVILHSIPASRMTMSYHLRWAYWSGVANRIRIEKKLNPREDVPHMFGVPRYWISKAARGVFRFAYEAAFLRITSRSYGIVGLMDALYMLGLVKGSRALKSNRD